MPPANNQPRRASSGEATERPADVALWQHLRKYWATALAATVLVITGTVFYTLGQKRIYETEATVMFDPNPPRPLGHRVESVVEMGSSASWNNQEYYETQYAIIQSRRVALAVVAEHGLNNDGAFLENLPPGQQPEAPVQTTPEEAAEVLRGRVTVQPVLDSRLANVRLRDADPERALRILQTLVETYERQNLDNALTSTTSATDWLRSQLDALKADLEKSELELYQYKKDHDILSVAFDDKSSMLGDEMSQINEEHTRVRALQQEASARRRQLAGARADDPTRIQAHELLRSPLMQTLRTQYAIALSERDALLGMNKGINHPDVKSASERVKAAETAILTEIANIKRAYDGDVAMLSRQAGGLHGMLESAKKQAHELNLLEIEYRRLARAKDNAEKLYAIVLERTKEADLSQMLRVNNVSIIDQPLLPSAPVSPRVPLYLMVGVFLGLAFGIASAFARGLLDRTIKVPEDIELELGVTVLGLLPQSDKNANGAYYGKSKNKRKRGAVLAEQGKSELVAHHNPMSSIAEAARSIRTNLMFMAPDNPYRRLLVTSAGPSEGKTTVACCIAVAMAQAGQRVLLVDCDLRRPRIRRVFDITSERGLTTALFDDELDDALFESEVPNLTILPAGPVPPNPAELFHTDRFKRLLDEAASKFDRVIIDSPPVVAVTDPTILSTLVDGTVLVVRANATRKELARHALRSLQAVSGNLSGVVLNAVDFSRSEYSYSYSYYRRGEYYGTPPANDDDRDSAPPPPMSAANA